MPEQRTGAQIMCEALIREGVEIMFGIPGGAIMPFYYAMYEYRDQLHHVLCRHEQGAGHAAEGYARATGRPGVCVATSGPGATNLVTAIADAWMDSTPLVAIVGQVPSHLLGKDAFQETNITAITAPITKRNYLVTKPDDLPQVFHEAFHVATMGRTRPVLIAVTKDAQQAYTAPNWDTFPRGSAVAVVGAGQGPGAQRPGTTRPCRMGETGGSFRRLRLRPCPAPTKACLRCMLVA
jgi:acetolactate synthase-1/2/3 large subunit